MAGRLADNYILEGRYRLTRLIGYGSWGHVYLAVDTETGEEVAVKVEVQNDFPSLENEKKVYSILQDVSSIGFPHKRCYGRENGKQFLVLDLLGPSLGDLFGACSRQFTLKTVLMIAVQMISLLELLHKKNLIHRDIKAENFLMGIGKHSDKLYLADFGLAKHYRNYKTHCHIPYRNKNIRGLCGTPRYTSINAHQLREQGRRDDLESIGYVLVYFLKGSLPWMGLENGPEKYAKIGQMKMDIPLKVLCNDIPDEFSTYLNYCRRLQFEEEPDYKYLRTLFWNLFQRNNFKSDGNFDWVSNQGEKRSEESPAENKTNESTEISLSTAFRHLSPISTHALQGTDVPTYFLIQAMEGIAQISSTCTHPQELDHQRFKTSTPKMSERDSDEGPSISNSKKVAGPSRPRDTQKLKGTGESAAASKYYYVTKSGRFVKPPRRLIEE